MAACITKGKSLHYFNKINFNIIDGVKYIPNNKAVTSPFIEYALMAADEALEDAKLTTLTEQQQLRTGVSIGSGIGSLDDITSTHQTLSSQVINIYSFLITKSIKCNKTIGN